MSWWIILPLLWIAPSPITAGICFAYFQAKFPSIAKQDRREDLGFAWFLALLSGPVGLVVELFMSGFAEHGWRLR
jgi:hypothetical protein